MILFILVAAFIVFVIAVLATDRSQGRYEDRQKELAKKMYGQQQPQKDDERGGTECAVVVGHTRNGQLPLGNVT